MKQILVFGDSLSWGIVPGTRARLPFHQRWPGVLEAALIDMGLSARVFEDCLNGRRTTTDDPVRKGRNGLLSVSRAIEANSPLDLIVVLLGTNDFQVTPAFNAAEAANGVAQLVQEMRSTPIEPGMIIPPILVIAPPPVHEPKGTMSEKFQGAQERCLALSEAYQAMCSKSNCEFFDAATVIATSTVDGVHIDSAHHAALGRAVANLVSAKFLGA